MPRWFFAAVLLLSVATTWSALPSWALEAGDSVFTMAEPTGVMPDAPIRVFAHRPVRWTTDRPVLIVMHGVNRDADRYLADWREHAERHNVLVVCPEFSAVKYPGARWYNLGNLVDRERGGQVQPAPARTFGVIDRVWHEVRRRTGAARAGFLLFGHSAGAQFVHRYVMFADQSAAEAVVIANAGWYSFPVQTVAFPYGLGGMSIDPAAAFARPVTILLGEGDTDPRHPSLRRNAEADAQGDHRFARGQAFFAAARGEAARLGVPFAWRLGTVPDVGHSNAGMADAAMRLLVP